MQVLLPPDIEEILNLPNGHIFHGELSVDQLFIKRPVAHYADYRTPIRGLYLCGSSAHPGGGVSGIPATTPPARSSRTCAGNDGGQHPGGGPDDRGPDRSSRAIFAR